MRKPKAPAPINLPYASTVASFYGDQGAVQGNSFLGKMFRGLGQTPTQTQGQPGRAGGAASPMLAALFGTMGMGTTTQRQGTSAAKPAAVPSVKSFISGMM